MNNLSSSFTKWRKEGRGHNSSGVSEKSSMLSLACSDIGDASIASRVTQDYDPIEQQAIMFAEATPKMMRKRKLSGEIVPFSASKK